MSRLIKAVRPDDGEVLEVTEKVFVLILQPRGWTVETIVESREEPLKREPARRTKA